MRREAGDAKSESHAGLDWAGLGWAWLGGASHLYSKQSSWYFSEYSMRAAMIPS